MNKSLLFIIRNLIFLICIYVFVSFPPAASANDSVASAGSPDAVYVTNTTKNELKIMMWNVENLFDTVHDDGYNDHTFLPKADPLKEAGCQQMAPGHYKAECFKTDWTADKLQIKLGQIQKLLDYQGSLPDVIGLSEIENDNVLRMLADSLGYQFLMGKGEDGRGIETALLYKTDKLRLIEDASFPMKPAGKKSRNILRAHFDVLGLTNSSTLVVYVNHWASMANPTQERIDSAKILRKNIDELIENHPNEEMNIVALGDFNTNDKETPNAIDLLHDPKWDNQMLDGELLAKASKNPSLALMPPGTFYYKSDKAWNRFDRAILSQNLNDGSNLEFMPTSFRVLYMELNTQFLNPTQVPGKKPQANFRIPWTYDHDASTEADAGFSDHLPVVFKLKIKKKAAKIK